MRLDFQFPALLRITPHGHRSEKTAVLTCLGQVDVPEITGAEAPLVARTIQGKDHARWRLFEGRLHRSNGDPNKAERETSVGRADQPWSRGRAALMDAVQARATVFGSAEIWPEMSRRLISANRAWPLSVAIRASEAEDARSFNFEPASWHDLEPRAARGYEEWEAAALDVYSECFFCEGMFYSPADEPFIRISRSSKRRSLHNPAYRDDSRGWPYGNSKASPELWTLHPLTQARPLGVVSTARCNDWERIGVDVLEPDAFGSGYHGSELERAARNIVHVVGDRFFRPRLPRDRGPGLEGLDEGVWADLHAATLACDGRHDRVAAALERFVRWAGFGDPYGMNPAKNDPVMRAAESTAFATLNMWHERPVDLSEVAVSAPSPFQR